MHLYLYYLQLQFTSHKRNITVILSSHSSERMPYLCGSCSLDNRTKTRFYLNLFFFGLFHIFQAMLLQQARGSTMPGMQCSSKGHGDFLTAPGELAKLTQLVIFSKSSWMNISFSQIQMNLFSLTFQEMRYSLIFMCGTTRSCLTLSGPSNSFYSLENPSTNENSFCSTN